MGTFLSIIGVLALIFFGKFIYDTFLTNNTEQRWDDFKQDHPEEAVQIERNEGLDFKTTVAKDYTQKDPVNMESPEVETNQYEGWNQDKKDSLKRIVENMGCDESMVQVKHSLALNIQLMELGDEGYKTDEIRSKLLEILNRAKEEEARTFNILPNDTAAAIMEEWTNHYFETLIEGLW